MSDRRWCSIVSFTEEGLPLTNMVAESTRLQSCVRTHMELPDKICQSRGWSHHKTNQNWALMLDLQVVDSKGRYTNCEMNFASQIYIGGNVRTAAGYWNWGPNGLYRTLKWAAWGPVKDLRSPKWSQDRFAQFWSSILGPIWRPFRNMFRVFFATSFLNVFYYVLGSVLGSILT